MPPCPLVAWYSHVLILATGASANLRRAAAGEAAAAAAAAEEMTPGQLVHGRHTSGPPDDWREFDPARDPGSIRAATLQHSLSLVEVAILAASVDSNLADFSEFFGPATDFVSYSWHGTTCGELWASLKSRTQETWGPSTFFWVDIFAVAQNDTQPCDLEFERVIATSQRAVAVMSPWFQPKMLGRCWCLHELHQIQLSGTPLIVALPPSDAAAFRGAIAANFGTILMTMIACVNSAAAVASRPEDQQRILQAIRDDCGFDELDVQVLTLLNMWLRSVSGDDNQQVRETHRPTLQCLKQQWIRPVDLTGVGPVCRRGLRASKCSIIGGDSTRSGRKSARVVATLASPWLTVCSLWAALMAS